MQITCSMTYGYSGLLVLNSSAMLNVNAVITEEEAFTAGPEHTDTASFIKACRGLLQAGCKVKLAKLIGSEDAKVTQALLLQLHVISFAFQVTSDG